MPEKTKFRFKTFEEMERYFKALEPHPGPETFIRDEILVYIELVAKNYDSPQELWYALCREESEGTYIEENNPDNWFNETHLNLFQDKHLYK